jgi:hypothetical protein
MRREEVDFPVEVWRRNGRPGEKDQVSLGCEDVRVDVGVQKKCGSKTKIIPCRFLASQELLKLEILNLNP